MASNTQTFNLTIGGVTTAITNITQLEATVQQLDQQLATATFGTQQFADLQEEARRARAALAQVQAQVQTTSRAAGQAGQAAGQMGQQFQSAFQLTSLAGGQTGQVLGQLQGNLGSLRTGLGTVQKAFGGVRTAMLAIPLVLLLAGFTALVSYFTKTQDGADYLDRKLKSLSVIMAVLTDKVSAVGKSLFDAFSNPKQAIKDLVDTIQNNLTNRLKAFGVILEAIQNRDFSQLRDGVIQLGTGITDATSKAKKFANELAAAGKAGEAIELENQRILLSERQLSVERANSREQIKKLNLLAEDTTKSSKVRSEAARKAGEIEIGLNKKLLGLQDAKIKNLKSEQALTNNMDADNDALAALEVRRAEISSESLELRTTLNNKVNTIVQGEINANKAAADKKAADSKVASEKLAAELKALREKEAQDTEKSEDIQLEIQKKTLERRLALEKAGSPAFLQIQLEARKLEEDAQLLSIDRRYEKAGPRERAALLKQKEDIMAAGKAADAKLEADNTKLSQEQAKNKRVQAAQEEKALAEVHLVGVLEGSKAYYVALQQQVNAEEKLALAQLDDTKENENARTLIIKQAIEQRKRIMVEEAQKPVNIGTTILTQIFGVKEEEVGKVKAAIDSMTTHVLETTMNLLSQLSEARKKALDAQVEENQVVIDAARQASDLLKSELDESESRIDDLEAKLVKAKGVERQKLIEQLAVERQRHQQINQDRAREDARIKQAEAQKIALEKQKTQEAEKQAKVQQVLNALGAVSVAIGAVEAVASAGKGGKFGFDNVAYIVAATAAMAGAFVAVKTAAKGFAAGGFTGAGQGTPDSSGYRVAGVVHENEYVVPKWMVTSPKYQGTIAQLEAARISGGSPGYAEGGYVPVVVPPAQQGVDMSILVAMNQELISLRADTNAALAKPSYISHEEYRNYDAKTVQIKEYFLN